MRFNKLSSIKYSAKMIGILSFLLFIQISLGAEIESYVKIKYENITLFDMAPSLVSKDKGETVILGKIKVPGGKFIINADKLKAELYNLGIKPKSIPPSITVERDFVELSTKQVEENILKELQKGKTDFDYTVFISTRDTLRMPTGELRFSVAEGSLDKLGKKTLKAMVYEGEKLVYEFPFSITTGKVIKEYTLIKDVQKGEVFDPSQVSIKSELVLEETKLNNLDIPKDAVYSESLLAGTKLNENSLTSNTLIKKGDKIRIEIYYGQMQISDKGEALERGDVGQEISVKNLRTGKTVKGVVTSNTSVELKIQ